MVGRRSASDKFKRNLRSRTRRSRAKVKRSKRSRAKTRRYRSSKASCVSIFDDTPLVKFLQEIIVAKKGVRRFAMTGITKCVHDGEIEWTVTVKAEIPLYGTLKTNMTMTFGGGANYPLLIGFRNPVLSTLLGDISIEHPINYRACEPESLITSSNIDGDGLAHFIRTIFNFKMHQKGFPLSLTRLHILKCENSFTVEVEIRHPKIEIDIQTVCDLRFSYHNFTLHVTYEVDVNLPLFQTLFTLVPYHIFTCVPLYTISSEEKYYGLITGGERDLNACNVFIPDEKCGGAGDYEIRQKEIYDNSQETWDKMCIAKTGNTKARAIKTDCSWGRKY